jgi:hypothetical protein
MWIHAIITTLRAAVNLGMKVKLLNALHATQVGSLPVGRTSANHAHPEHTLQPTRQPNALDVLPTLTRFFPTALNASPVKSWQAQYAQMAFPWLYEATGSIRETQPSCRKRL